MRLRSIIIGIFFGLLIVVGLGVHKDYGIPWDEPIQRKLGIHTYEYVLGQNEKLLKNSDRFYGQHYEVFLVSLEKIFNITDIQHIYQMRHLVNYLIFIVGVFFFYLILVKRLRSQTWAMLGSLMLILSPRIFAHSFYNSKDGIFLSLFIITAYVSLLFMEKRKVWLAFVVSLLTALLIGVRVLGVVLPILVLDLFFYNRTELREKRNKRLLTFYVLATGLLVVLFWPILWEGPITNFIEAFKYYPQKTGVVFFGERINSHIVPWYYTIGWILVSTPYSYLILFFVGIWRFVLKIPEVIREDLLMLGWLVLPLVSTIVMGSVLHDAWRHMLFIYPPILYFAVLGLARSSPTFIKVGLILLAINVFSIVSFMVTVHPYQNMYFNEFVRPPYENKFSLDYWGLSYKEGYEYIARNDDRSLIKVFSDNYPGETNLWMLPEEDRNRFLFVSGRGSEDYYLTNYRDSMDLYYEPTFFDISVNKTRILGIHRHVR